MITPGLALYCKPVPLATNSRQNMALARDPSITQVEDIVTTVAASSHELGTVKDGNLYSNLCKEGSALSVVSIGSSAREAEQSKKASTKEGEKIGEKGNGKKDLVSSP
ncbi:hypothetical protein VTI74DRAFT_3705 [Chaetomium olivicolor]